ncbi:6165_t:CDS:2 [Cetraspora pellucida]|uniref:6165_t:CDS:1 n=1 Tax=Cetraspora pellucida TaxID=1433469 RepID=A0ACA9Q7K9_9GLOM|nr:6165_t:CDS:2 [Cetraspora pellucida]
MPPLPINLVAVPIAFINAVLKDEDESNDRTTNSSKTQQNKLLISPAEKELKIYDDPKPEIIIVKSPTRLEEGIRHTRLQISQTISDLKQHTQNVTDQWIGVEQNTEKAIKEVISPNERLMPEVLYVIVAGLAGSIAARNFVRKSNILVRITSPVLFTVVSSYYFLPQTSRNIMAKICEYEKRSPELMKIHNSVSDAANNTKQKINSLINFKSNRTEDRKKS